MHPPTVLADVRRLLAQTNQIKSRNDQIVLLKRESFNVFSLLRKEHDEVFLHSAFISEILNPKGSHQMGTIFAELFFKEIGKSFPIDSTTSVESEKVLPNCRADIYIQTGRQECIIENKIFAGDQENQLGRNREYLHARDPSGSLLIYLTLDGRESADAKVFSADALKDDWYQQISYREHVLQWLKRCREKAVDHAPLRETIKQYIHLVKKLTGQLTNDEMSEELSGIIRNNFVAAELISKQISTVKIEAVTSFFEQLTAGCKNGLGDGWAINAVGNSFEAMATGNWKSLVISHESWPKAVRIEVQGQPNSIDHRTVFGIVANKNEVDRAAVDSAIASLALYEQNRKNILWWAYQQELFNFGDPTNMTLLFDPEKRQQLLKTSLTLISSLCRDCQVILGRI